MIDYIEIVNTNSSIVTLKDFADDYGIVFSEKFTIDDLVDYLDNSEIIKSFYSEKELQDYGDSPQNLIKVGTIIKIPKEQVNQEILAVASNIVVPNENLNVFLDKKIKELYNQTDFKKIQLSEIKSSKTSKLVNSFSVWIYCKSFEKIFNLTPFISSLTTNVTESGGNFEIQLSPLIIENSSSDLNVEGFLKEIYIRGISNILSKQSLYRIEDDEPKRNLILFHHLISNNDIVFIRFETLEIERKRKLQEDKDVFDSLFVDSSELKDCLFDMIGLVDTNIVSFAPESTNITISITGRDMMKLLLDDGCYFYPEELAGIIDVSLEENRPVKRLISGELASFSAFTDRTIDYSIRWIFNVLSNISICPDELFDYIEDKTVRYKEAEAFLPLRDPTPFSNEQKIAGVQTFLEKENVSGIWQVIKLIVDERISNRKIVDSSITTHQGSIMSFIQKLCMTPFVEFFGDTYLDKFYFVVRKPPFDQEGIESMIREGLIIDIEEDSVYGDSLGFDYEKFYSWYRILPKGNFMGNTEGLSLTLFPVKFFPRIAELWGVKAFDVVSNYINFKSINNVTQAIDLDYVKQQGLEDLAYMISSTIYLPFTRKGTIYCQGDRRIKRGMLVRYKSTGEIFYVDSVSQNSSVSETTVVRTTVLNVSHGIIEKYIQKYFSIVDFKKTEKGYGEVKNFEFKDDVFDFFLKRKQFFPEEK